MLGDRVGTAERWRGTELGQQRDGGGQIWDSGEMVGDRVRMELNAGIDSLTSWT